MTVSALTELFLMNMGYARSDAAEPDVVEEYAGVLLRWLNEGYARAVRRVLGRSALDSLDPLRAEEDEPVKLDETLHPCLADYALLPLGERMLFVTHGHRFHKDAMPPLQDGDILLHGHTHIPTWDAYGENFIFNPGSVSIPKAGSAHGYMTLEDTHFAWKNMDGKTYKEYTF